MVVFIINIILGLFIWMVVPNLLAGIPIIKRGIPKSFLNIACKIIGLAVIISSILGLF
jgi:hypothetical protein